MPNTNASFSPRMRSDDLNDKLDALDHHVPVQPKPW